MDVLVNSVNKELELSRGNVSKALDDATGGLLQKECKRQFSNGIVPGQVAVTSFHGKSTAEQKVYHGVLYCFPRGEQNEPTEEECWKVGSGRKKKIPEQYIHAIISSPGGKDQGELLPYRGLRCPSVVHLLSSVCASTIYSNDFF